MRTLLEKEFLALKEGSKVIEADSYGDKVLKLADNTYLKLFRRKRLISSSLFSPYAKRFTNNAKKLTEKGIPTINVLATYRIPSIQRTMVHYAPLPGTTLRQLNKIDASSSLKLGKFIRDLHDTGIYFRSLHLGNIVLNPENQLGLIDISDMAIQKKPLSKSKRLRNFKHLSRYKNDLRLINQSIDSFINGYCLKHEETFFTDSLDNFITHYLSKK